MDLSIQLPNQGKKGRVQLTECLNQFIEPETIEKCGYKCERCGAVDSATKQVSLFRLPRALVIHSKRFSNRKKIDTTVVIPETLDMRPFAPHLQESDKLQSTQYRLYGISHHAGSLHGGHYTAEVLNVDKNAWYSCNDARVMEISKHRSENAYVLFYIRI